MVTLLGIVWSTYDKVHTGHDVCIYRWTYVRMSINAYIPVVGARYERATRARSVLRTLRGLVIILGEEVVVVNIKKMSERYPIQNLKYLRTSVIVNGYGFGLTERDEQRFNEKVYSLHL